MIPPIFVLCHPEYEPIRYRILLSHFEKRRIPMDRVHWVRGPWGSEITVGDFFKVYEPFLCRYGFAKALSFKSAGLLRGEVSLVLSFYMALCQALDMYPDDKFIFFESDVVLREDFLERLDSVLSAEVKWDYISLGEGVGTRPKGAGFSYFGETRLFTPEHQFVFRCTDSMLLRREFLLSLRRTLLPFRECLDWELNFQICLHKGKSFWADPPLVEPGSGRWRFLSLLPG